MKTPLLLALLLGCSTSVLAQQVVAPEPLGEPATTVYRQVTPDGRVVYSDKAQRGAKIDHTLKLEPVVEGSTWSAEGGKRPVAPERSERTPVKQVATIPPSGRKKTVEEANSDVIRAEMLLEDARRKRDAGHTPLPEEKGEAGPNSAYAKRQKALAQEVAHAEAALKRATSERDTLRRKP